MFGRIMAVVVAVIVLLTSVLSGLGLYTLTSRQTAIRQENLRAEAREIAYLASLYSGGSSTYTWISEDEGIASVDSNGKVTAISQGTVNVLVTDGTKKGVCIVRCNVGTQSGSSTSSTTSSSGSGTTSSSGLKTGAAVVVNGGNGVFVRSGPGTSYEALATIPNGAEVKILESAGDGWYKISFAGTGGASTTGYMKGDFLSNG